MNSKDAQERLSQLRLILHGAPSKKAWVSLYALLDQFPCGDDREIAVDYAREHLNHWPSELKQAPYTWRNQPDLNSLASSLSPVYLGLDINFYRGRDPETTFAWSLGVGAWYNGQIRLLDHQITKDRQPDLSEYLPYKGYADPSPGN